MDHQDLVHPEALHAVPAEHPVRGQGVGEADGPVPLAVGVDVAIVGQEQVHPAEAVAALQGIQEGRQVAAEGVVAVHALEIFAGGLGQTLIDARPVAPVGLMDGPDDGGIFFLIGIGNFAGPVRGPVVHHQHLHPLAALDQAVQAGFQIILGVIAGDHDAQQFHSVSSCIAFSNSLTARLFRKKSAMVRPRPRQK